MLARCRILAASPLLRESRRYARRLSWQERAEAVYHPDKVLDNVLRCESAANVVRKVVGVLLSQEAHIMSMDDLRRGSIKRKIRVIIREVAARFPLVFKFRRDDHGEFWIELTPEVEEIVRREMAAASQPDEQESVIKLKKLLMMAKHHRIGLEQLGHLKHDLFLPDDLKKRLIPQHPESFRIITEVPPHDLPHVELVGWEPSLAVTARELSAVPLEPHGFPVHSLRGQTMEADLLRRFQELPFVSPYEDPGRIEWTSLEAEKRAVAVMHELLSLMPMKKAFFVRFNLIHKELRLPAKFIHLVGQYPWIFYVCKVVPENPTIFLRDGYQRSSLKFPNWLSIARGELLTLMQTVYERERGEPPRTVKLDIADEDKESIADYFVGFQGNLRNL